MWPGQEVSVMHMWVSQERGVCPEIDVANNNFSFSFSATTVSVCVCNHVPSPFVLKTAHVCAMQTWLLQYKLKKVECYA